MKHYTMMPFIKTGWIVSNRNGASGFFEDFDAAKRCMDRGNKVYESYIRSLESGDCYEDWE